MASYLSAVIVSATHDAHAFVAERQQRHVPLFTIVGKRTVAVTQHAGTLLILATHAVSVCGFHLGEFPLLRRVERLKPIPWQALSGDSEVTTVQTTRMA